MSRHFSDNVNRVAEQVTRQVERGVKRLEVTLSLPSRPALLLAVRVREQLSRRTWELTLLGDDPCRLCRRNVEALGSEGASPLELARLIYHAAEVIASCECGTAARTGRRGEPAHTSPPRRINVLPQGSSADAAPPSTAGVIKIKPAPSVSSPSREGDNAGEVREGPPSLHYSLASGVAVGVTLTSHVCRLLVRHCSESNRHGREVGGVIAGYSFEAQAADGRKHIQTVATDIIPVESSDSSGAHLSLSEEDWLYVQNQFDAKYSAQGKVRVGWYHTHPTQSVFFSNMDVDAHTVFRQPHQFALVVDPRKMEVGLFYWKDYERLLHAGPLRFMLEARGTSERDDPSDGSGLRKSLAAYAVAARGRLEGRSLVVSTVVLLMLSAALYLLNRQLMPPAGGTPPPKATQLQATDAMPRVPGDDAQATQPTHLLLVSDRIVNGKTTRTLASGAAKVTYEAAPPEDGRARWNAPKDLESAFFRTIFDWEIKWTQSTTEQEVFQSALGLAEPDGLWGNETRAAFLSKAVELRKSGELLVFKLGRNDVRVRFLNESAGAPAGQR